MERIFAFTDEYGAFGWDFSQKDVSTHFIITAIIVKESDLGFLREEVEKIRKKHFQTGEIKSSKVGKNHKRRKRILADLIKLPFTVFPVIINKKLCEKYKGLHFKKSFYKFTNNIMHKELRRSFSKITIVADEIGANDYMKSFIEYVLQNEEIPNLFGESDFMFQDSRQDVLVQLADFISGSLAYCYDDNKKTEDAPNYKKLLDKKLSCEKLYPKTYENHIFDNNAISDEYDIDVANLCYKQASIFLNQNKDSDDEEIQAQYIVLDYLLFRFLNNDLRGYIPTKELKNQLLYTGMRDISTSTFRLKIICKLRDKGVIIASSPKGYKLPAKQSELYDFVNHGVSILIPMLERLRKCRNLVKLATQNELDLFDKQEYEPIRRYFDIADNIIDKKSNEV